MRPSEPRDHEDGGAELPGEGRLESWKEIAVHLGRTVRTVQRWEKVAGLPIRRHRHDVGASVFAFRHELDEWRARRSRELLAEVDAADEVGEDASGDAADDDAASSGTESSSIESSTNESRPRGESEVPVVAEGLERSWAALEEREPEIAPPDPSAAAAGNRGAEAGLAEMPRASVDAAATPAPRASRATVAPNSRWLLVAVGLLAVVAVLWSLALFDRETRPQSTPAPMASLLTTSPGLERSPALSPDGRQVVYVWDEDGSADLYVRLIGAGQPLRLTDDPGVEESPAWSPDGLLISFLRRGGVGRRELLIVPALGGAERLLATLAVPAELDKARSVGASMTWSPDGRFLAVTESGTRPGSMAIVAVDVRTGERRPLTDPPAAVEDLAPAFSPTGDRLAFTRSTSSLTGALHVLEIGRDSTGPSPGRLVALPSAGDWNADPAWTPDGRELVFGSGRWPRSALWRVAADGSSPPRPLAGAGLGASQPTVAPMPVGPEPRRAHLPAWRLVYTAIELDNDIWRTPLSEAGTAAGAGDERLIGSTQRERFPAYSPDGSRIAFLSDRSGHREVWVADAGGRDAGGRDAGGRNAEQWTAWESSYIWRPSWSPDGRRLAYAVELDNVLRAYVQDQPLARARPVTGDGASDDDLAWSRSGGSLYISSRDRGGEGGGIWRADLDGAEPLRRVARIAGQPLGEDPSGGSLFVAIGEVGSMELLRVPLAGVGAGEPETVAVAGEDPVSFTLGPDGVYYVAGHGRSENAFELRRLGFDDGRDVVVTTIPEPEVGISISPDGRFLLTSRVGLMRSDLMLVDGLR